jgi:hypothetical protein
VKGTAETIGSLEGFPSVLADRGDIGREIKGGGVLADASHTIGSSAARVLADAGCVFIGRGRLLSISQRYPGMAYAASADFTCACIFFSGLRASSRHD